MATILQVMSPTPRDRHRTPTGCFAEAAGSASPGSAGQQIAADSRLTAGAATWAFALSGPLSVLFFTFLPCEGRELIPKERQ